MKLPTCPYCKARFLYPDAKKRMERRTGVCPNCGKKYRVSRLGTAGFILCAAVLLIAVDFGLLSIPDMNLPVLCVITVAGVVAAYFLLPFFVRFLRAG